MTGALL